VKFSAGDVEANKTCYDDVGTKGVFAVTLENLPGTGRSSKAHDFLSLGIVSWLLSCLAVRIPTGPKALFSYSPKIFLSIPSNLWTHA